ncbi:MAG: DUF899 family protein [Acidimicrobiales bacterium]|jgi:predicted dithiol-disulfide oxidoreductase (DUF899 family)
MEFTNLAAESGTYRDAREALRLAEVDLMRRREDVARMRRDLPPGPPVSDYEFVAYGSGDGTDRPVRLSELFSGPDRPLIVYHLMFGKRQTTPCPMCTMWVDGFNGIARHLAPNVDFAVVAAAGTGPLREFAARRGWDGLRMLSAGDSTFKYDLGSEDAEGNQDSRISVFVKDADGRVRHTYTSSPHLSDEIDQRGIDLLCATWHLLDLTPQGRGDWYAALDYPA